MHEVTTGRGLSTRLALAAVVLAVVLALAALWALDGFDAMARAATAGQRWAQNEMAGGLRALKGGEAGAFWALMGVAFGYGVFHAAGPGHGKMLIGGYGLAAAVPVRRLVVIALASSLAQATTAVALVYAGVLALGWTRQQVVGLTDDTLAPLGHLAVAAVGIWLVLRGARGLRRWGRAGWGARDHAGHEHAAHDQAHHGHGHHEHAHHDHPHHGAPAAAAPAHSGHGPLHPHAPVCETCGHAHGPSLEQVAEVRSLRDALVLIAGIAVRPCSGALFLLILTWQMGVAGAGIVGTYVMGLGTALVTVGVALLAGGMRAGTLASLAGTRGFALAVPALELGAGLAVALIAGGLALAAL
ncbi:hypothetical protein GVY41_07920 [Frigidibacter albus]|uniref:Nickel/cobalt efflux system n=1 Tax=Frigidibacter albus TaxID=1465486 RepID=A0A6L8VI56_9RHOB|nr:hypothetical protein [Frigidibacter albus]MZQ89019.1 hypothetical protein [Frigidibacter albus]NBE30924.1 hypothetical protein [Frigidibacter albus]GGH51906.1 hypothetical protein GCM10011341_15900 [Frigidibacter albus]